MSQVIADYSENEARVIAEARGILAERVARLDRGAKLKGLSDALDYLVVQLGDKAREACFVVSLDSAGRVVGMDHISDGSVSSVSAPMREIFRFALLRNATSIILAHNHPSGSALPSDEDLQLTYSASRIADMLSIRLLDHVIVAGGVARSLAPEAEKWARRNLTPKRKGAAR